MPSNIQKDFGPIIKVNENGVVVGIHHMQNHHVMLKSNNYFKEIFAKAGISIDDRIN